MKATKMMTSMVLAMSIALCGAAGALAQQETQNLEPKKAAPTIEQAKKDEPSVKTEARKNGIGAKTALDAALADAGLTEDKVTSIEVELDREDGISVYEVVFSAEGQRYNYHIDPEDGSVLGMSSAARSNAAEKKGKKAEPRKKDAGMQAARAAALAEIGLDEADAVSIRERLDRDDGRSMYEFDILTEDMEHEIEIDAESGKIMGKHRELLGFNAKMVQDGALIGIDRAKEIAVADAGLTVEGVTFRKAKLENDDGWTQYEVKFRSDGASYEYCIEATTGMILEAEMDCGR